MRCEKKEKKIERNEDKLESCIHRVFSLSLSAAVTADAVIVRYLKSTRWDKLLYIFAHANASICSVSLFSFRAHRCILVLVV